MNSAQAKADRLSRQEKKIADAEEQASTMEKVAARTDDILRKMEEGYKARYGYQSTEPYYNLGDPKHEFDIVWQDGEGDLYKTRVAAHNSEDAAWRVHGQVYVTGTPADQRQLIAVFTIR